MTKKPDPAAEEKRLATMGSEAAKLYNYLMAHLGFMHLNMEVARKAAAVEKRSDSAIPDIIHLWKSLPDPEPERVKIIAVRCNVTERQVRRVVSKEGLRKKFNPPTDASN